MFEKVLPGALSGRSQRLESRTRGAERHELPARKGPSSSSRRRHCTFTVPAPTTHRFFSTDSSHAPSEEGCVIPFKG